MNPPRLISSFALVLGACTDATPAVDRDTAPTQSCSLPGGRTIGAGMWFGGQDGCNMCRCDAPDAPFCYRAGCGDASIGLRCQTSADCGGFSTCLFDQGCDGTPGYCVSATQGCAPGAPTDMPGGAVFCGCDGRTYASQCPSVRYAHLGACTTP